MVIHIIHNIKDNEEMEIQGYGVGTGAGWSRSHEPDSN